MTKTRTLAFAAMATASIMLGGCSTDPYDRPSVAHAVDTLQGQKQAVQSRLTTAAAEAIAAGKTEEALEHYQKLYRNDKRDTSHALNYAQLLRRSGRSEEALKVLQPFAKQALNSKKATVSPLLLNEYAAILIEHGKLADARSVIDLVLAEDAYANSHADAMNLLGISLDAQGRHKEAETMFRLALEGWHGNPTTVMNNLALCLANQAMFDESLTTLRQALVMAPDKQEIARNIQLVSELRDNVVSKPVDIKKN